EPTASEADLSFAGLSDLLAGVLPEVINGIPGPQREALEVALLLRPAVDQPPTAHAVGLAALAALRASLAHGPALLAVDDVQWLDEASLDALVFALRRVTSGPLSVLLAARTEAPADPQTAGAPPLPRGGRELLAAPPAAEVIDLAPLDHWQVQNMLPATVTAAQARLVARQSRGNPFWVLQIAASLDSADGPVPPLARALTDRLSRALSHDAAEALAIVAAAGRITVGEALSVLDHLDDPAGALDAAIPARGGTQTRGPDPRGAPADRRRLGRVAAAGPPGEGVPAARRRRPRRGAVRAFRGAGRRARSGPPGGGRARRGRRRRARPGGQRRGR